MEYEKWFCVIDASDRILSKVDEAKEKSKVTIDIDKECSMSGNEPYSDTFVELSDGNMVTINELLPAGLEATPRNKF